MPPFDPRFHLPRGRLFQRVFVSLGSALLAAFLVVVFLTLGVGTSTLRQNVQRDLAGTAHTAHLAIEHFLDSRRAEVRLAAETDVMDDVLIGDPDMRIQNELMRLLRTVPGVYAGAYTVDENGTVVASTQVELIGERAPFDPLALGPSADGTRISARPLAMPGSGKDVLVMARAIHSRLHKGPAGWLVCLVDWRALEHTLGSIAVAGPEQGPHAFVVLFSGGQPIAGPREWWAAAEHARSMTIVHHALSDDVHHDAASSAEVAGAPERGPAEAWTFAVVRDSHEAFAMVRVFTWSALGAALFGLLIAAAVALQLAGELSRRLGALAEGSRQLAAGAFEQPVQDAHDDEIGDLARTFNTMAETVQTARATVEQKNRELESNNQQLREASKLKDEFLANTSHELRTPLNGILGFLGLVDDDLCDTREEERDHVKSALRCGRQLLQLIEDLLDVSRIEAGRLSLTTRVLHVAPELERISREFASAAAARGVALRVEPCEDAALAVRADQTRVHQVLRHLVDNAVKFTNEGSITLRCTAPEAMGHVQFEITDTGAGIAPERLHAVFDRFVQGDGSATRRHGGTGLGLSLARDLVEMMGGVMGLRSEGVGRGTTAWFTLPLGWGATEAKLPLTRDDAEPRVQGSGSGPLVLVVDDDPTLAAWLRAVLHAEGMRTATADSAERAWMMVRQLRPSLVLLDHAMPFSARARLRTGADLARTMANDPATREIPLVMLTAHDPRELLGVHALPPGVPVLQKPIQRPQLMAHVLQSLANHRPRALNVLAVHADPRFLTVLTRALPEPAFRLSLERNDARWLDVLRDQPRVFDAVVLELPAEPVAAAEAMRLHAELEAAPPLLALTAEPGAAPEAQDGAAFLPLAEVLRDPARLAHEVAALVFAASPATRARTAA